MPNSLFLKAGGTTAPVKGGGAAQGAEAARRAAKRKTSRLTENRSNPIHPATAAKSVPRLAGMNNAPANAVSIFKAPNTSPPLVPSRKPLRVDHMRPRRRAARHERSASRTLTTARSIPGTPTGSAPIAATLPRTPPSSTIPLSKKKEALSRPQRPANATSMPLAVTSRLRTARSRYFAGLLSGVAWASPESSACASEGEARDRWPLSSCPCGWSSSLEGRRR